MRLPATDCYYVVACPDKTTPSGDKLWLAIGTKERIGLADLLNFGKIKRFVRSFHEVRIQPVSSWSRNVSLPI